MTQTPQHVSLFQKLLRYFEIAASVGAMIPVAHVSAISTLLEGLAAELQGAGVLPNVGVIPGPVAVPDPSAVHLPVAPVHVDGPTGSIKN